MCDNTRFCKRFEDRYVTDYVPYVGVLSHANPAKTDRWQTAGARFARPWSANFATVSNELN